MKVLFVGNSFTYYNEMPSIFESIARVNGEEVETASVTKGGRSLLQHLESGDEYSLALRRALTERPDAVVLQEQSHTPISSNESFSYAVSELVKMARETGAVPYLYATWGYKAGHPKLELYGADTFDMEMKLRRAYAELGDGLGIEVCHAGAAMSYAYRHSDVELYRPDLYHPSLVGSVLAALTIYSTVFSKDPLELLLPEDLLTPKERGIIAKAAHAALFDRA